MLEAIVPLIINSLLLIFAGAKIILWIRDSKHGL